MPDQPEMIECLVDGVRFPRVPDNRPAKPKAAWPELKPWQKDCREYRIIARWKNRDEKSTPMMF